MSPITRSRLRFRISALLAIVLLILPAFSQDRARRIILKDGSYQLVTTYEIKGDRVRYMSAERHEWEELPKELVDWPATEKSEKDRAASASTPEAVQLDKELEAERAVDQASLPQVAAGLRLPLDSGVFLLESYNGEPQLVEVQQTAGDLNRNTKGNIFRGAINPVASAKQTIELEGEHSAVQSHVGVPSIYINIDENADQPKLADRHDSSQPSSSEKDAGGRAAAQGPQQPQQPQQAQQPSVPFDRFRILRAQSKGGKRILGDVKRAVTGKISQEQHFEKTTITRVTGGWLKLTPAEPLAPGEYALVEMMPKEGMNLYVWDFGINPNAPPNKNPWKPETKSAPKAPVAPEGPRQ